nr:hypothetical protein [Polymorphobacter sp.]
MSTPLALPAHTTFTPVPRKTLRGWTPDRQRRFIAALAATGSVAIAAQHVEMTREGAYLLRAAPGAQGFAAAWDAAVREGIRALKAVAFDRAIHGEPVPIYYQGAQVGERRQFNNSLLLRLLTHYDPQVPAAKSAAAAADATPKPSCAAVAARLASKRKPIAQMDATDFHRNQQWIDLHTLDRQLNELAFVRQLRRWIAEGGLENIHGHLDYMERTAAENPFITAAMRVELAATGAVARPWRAKLADLQQLLTAESVEASVAAGEIRP